MANSRLPERFNHISHAERIGHILTVLALGGGTIAMILIMASKTVGG